MSRTGLSRQETIGLFLGFVGVVIFGGTLPFTRIAVAALDPWFVTAGRAALAGVLAAALLLVLRRRIPRGPAMTRLVVVSICLVAGFPIGTGLAMVTVEASRGGVILGVLPLATAVVGVIVSGERPPLKFWIAAVLGAAIVVAFTLRDGVGGVSVGDAFLVLAIVSASTGYAISGKLAQQMPGWEVISWALVVALPVTLPFTLLLWPADAAAVPSASWWAFIYVALMSQYLAFFAWNAGLALGGVARVSQVQLLQVFVTLGIAAVLNREQVDLVTWAVAALVVVIVLVGARARRA
ncbi:MAG TPA: DMT family transporter [Saliniramus sp.]|nr:DMT family transporter [Saliniramus sp.]